MGLDNRRITIVFFFYLMLQAHGVVYEIKSEKKIHRVL